MLGWLDARRRTDRSDKEGREERNGSHPILFDLALLAPMDPWNASAAASRSVLVLEEGGRITANMVGEALVRGCVRSCSSQVERKAMEQGSIFDSTNMS